MNDNKKILDQVKNAVSPKKTYEKKLKKGDKLVFAAFGGGFTWGAMYLTWAYDS